MTKTQPKIERTSDGLLIVRLHQVSVNWDQTWEEAIRAGAPNTPKNYAIWQAGEQYPAPAGKTGIELIGMSLLGFDRNWQSWEGIDLAADKKARTAHPKQLFAIGQEYPNLNRILDKEFFAVVCLQKCSIGSLTCLPDLWFEDNKRLAGTFRADWEWASNFFVAVLGEVS